MPLLSVNDITMILLGLGILLAAARILGEVVSRFNQPAIIGELLAGVLLGPTVLGSIWPDAINAIFPQSGTPAIVLEGITTVAVVLFLMVAGMEVNLSSIFRQGRAALTVSVSGIVVPFGIGLVAALLVPRWLGLGDTVPPHIFALLFATAMAISALPVIAKTLIDLNLFRSDLGMIVIAAAVFDDLIGWIIFAIVLGMMTPADAHGMSLAGTISLVLLYVVFMLTVGRWVIHRILPWILARTSWPAGVLGFVMTLAMFGAAFTEWVGIHAVFGAFMVGVAVGDSPHFRQRTRSTIDQFVSSIFAPLFFASIGLHVDFVQHFDWMLVLAVLAVATVGKVLGCGLGARAAGVPWRESWAIGLAMNARGAMGIILGLLALQYRAIDERMFVALVIMALATSMLSGGLMLRILQRKTPRRFIDYLHQRGFVPQLQTTTREGVIAELAQAAAAVTHLDAATIKEAVIQRERMMPTGLGLGVAVPHARLSVLHRPVACMGLSREGVEFEAPDGQKSRIIFLILTPLHDDGAQLEILADISRTFLDPTVREGSLRANSYHEFLALLRTGEPQGDITRERR